MLRRALIALILAACNASPTGSPIASPAAPSASASSPAPIAGSGPPSSPAPPFDPTHVAVTLKAYARVDGGPLAFAAPVDGSGRLFVASQDGRIWTVRDGTVATTPMLDIGARISTGGERGLLGLALHPLFPADPRVFIDYTDTDGNTVVSSFILLAGDASHLDPASERIVFTTTQPYPNHNGGALLFGPDGDLYISLGDGGSGGDPQGNGQRLDTTLAKILRVDIDHAAGGHAYAIPPDNPFVGHPGARPEIWLYGLRNPWRMSFDRSTNVLWIGDVGQSAWEEVDAIPAGARGLNLGWNRMEGVHCFVPSTGCDPNGITPPVAEYGHDLGCTVIGGYVYRGTTYPVLAGGYLFADYCSGTIWAIAATSTTVTAPVQVGTTGSGVSAFGEDAAGELYVANLDGTISRVTAGSR